MTYADDLKVDIELLEEQLADLGAQRIERDHILKQKEKISADVVDELKNFSAIREQIEQAKKSKAEVDAAKNADLIQKEKELAERALFLDDQELNITGIANSQNQRETMLAKNYVANEEKKELLKQREESLASREKSLSEASRGHRNAVSTHNERVKAWVDKEAAFADKLIEHEAELRRMIDERLKIEAEWKLIHAGHAEIDAAKKKLEQRASELDAISSSHAKKAAELLEDEGRNKERDIAFEGREKDVAEREEAIKRLTDTLTLRELECQGREKALEKKERILFLKEQNNVRG